jgi:hypothetical protein
LCRTRREDCRYSWLAVISVVKLAVLLTGLR